MKDAAEAAKSVMSDLSNPLNLAIFTVGCLVVLAALVGLGISIYLAIAYSKYNKKESACGLTGEQVARQILNENGLEKIKVTASGSFLLGNSYSHLFKRVRLRHKTWQKKSVTALGMAAQKSALAVLDKEKDPDMRRRVRIDIFTTFGPFAFIPLLLTGAIMDFIIFKTNGLIMLCCCGLSVVFYIFSFVLTCLMLKTEKKAQERAYVLLQEDGLATEEELVMLRSLFRLYNIEYINNIILACLELVLRLLLAVAKSKGKSSSGN